MVNSLPHKIIRVVYERQQENWYLALMEISDGLSGLVEIPLFDVTSPQPERQHVGAILQALAEAELDGGSMDETYTDSRYEVVFQIRTARVSKRLSKEEAFARANDLTLEEARQQLFKRDPESRVHHELMAEGERRLGTEESSRYWLIQTRIRIGLSPLPAPPPED